MGFLRKVFGVQGQIDAANRTADAQIAATKQAAEGQVATLNAAARAAAQNQAQIAARAAMEAKAGEVVSAPLADAEVQLDLTAQSTINRRGRRAQFGRGVPTGVSI